jgi:predicted nucleic acid-binding protein
LIYLDASVLLPGLAADTHSSRIVAWYSDLGATLIVSDLANPEASAVLSRRARLGRLSQSAVENALLG